MLNKSFPQLGLRKMSLGGSFRPYVPATPGGLGGIARPSRFRARGTLKVTSSEVT